MLGEYGNIVHLAEAYLAEHGKLMIKDKAIEVMANL